MLETIYDSLTGLLSTATGTARYWFLDHQGSVAAMHDASKGALAAYEYGPYGAMHAYTGAPPNIGYTGQMWEPSLGQYFFAMRYYSPGVGRWMVAEPLGIDGPNLYHYGFANPVVTMDIGGLWTFNIGGGYVLAGGITIGWNGGQFSWSVQGGMGAGLWSGLDPTDQGPNPAAFGGGSFDFGIGGNIGAGVGVLGVGASHTTSGSIGSSGIYTQGADSLGGSIFGLGGELSAGWEVWDSWDPQGPRPLFMPTSGAKPVFGAGRGFGRFGVGGMGGVFMGSTVDFNEPNGCP